MLFCHLRHCRCLDRAHTIGDIIHIHQYTLARIRRMREETITAAHGEPTFPGTSTAEAKSERFSRFPNRVLALIVGGRSNVRKMREGSAMIGIARPFNSARADLDAIESRRAARVYETRCGRARISPGRSSPPIVEP